jgi:hypothetical protein
VKELKSTIKYKAQIPHTPELSSSKINSGPSEEVSSSEQQKSPKEPKLFKPTVAEKCEIHHHRVWIYGVQKEEASPFIDKLFNHRTSKHTKHTRRIRLIQNRNERVGWLFGRI